jgi:adenylate cyclase
MDPDMDLNDFKDKIIYIGSTAPGLFDNWATPLAGGVPGVELQATALANLLRNDYVSRLPPRVIYISIFILCLITALVTGGGMRVHSSGMLIQPTMLAAIIAAGYFLLSSKHIFLDVVPLLLSVIITFGLVTIINYLSERRHSRMVRTIFEHYLDHGVVDNLIANPDQVRLGGELRKCTVLFTDVANFTNTSEQLGPEQVVHFMNIYLNAMTDIIIEEGGFVDKFIGDEIIAIFGAPNILPDHAERACRATLRMHQKVKELQPEFREAGCKNEIFARTGISTGDVVIGNMGSDIRMNYTAMGNTMNLGARIEGINKIYGTRTLANETTAKESGMIFREIDTVQVKGKDQGERIFELIADGDMSRQDIDAFQTALELYRSQKWQDAADIFGRLAESGDPPSEVFLKRCRKYITNPPPKEWNSIYIMQTK